MITEGFKQVTFESKQVFEKYYRNVQIPFYWNSFIELCTRKWKFFYKEIDGCLVILKKQYLHQPCVYMVCPPIASDMSSDLYYREIELILNFQKEGISSNITTAYTGFEEVKRWNTIILRKTEFIEYIFKADDYLEMSGSQFRGLRNEYKQGEKHLTDLIIENEINIDTSVKLSKLYKAWHATRPHFDFMKFTEPSVLLNNKERLKLNIITDKDGKLIYMSLFEKLNENCYVNILRCNTFDNTCNIKYSNQFGFVYDMKNLGLSGLVNMGIGGSKGQDGYKQMLHPSIYAQIYATGSKVVSRELYDSLGLEETKLF